MTGLRAGELVALRAKNLDLTRRRVEVNASGSEAYGQLQIVATPRTKRAQRATPEPSTELHSSAYPPQRDVWLRPDPWHCPCPASSARVMAGLLGEVVPSKEVSGQPLGSIESGTGKGELVLRRHSGVTGDL